MDRHCYAVVFVVCCVCDGGQDESVEVVMVRRKVVVSKYAIYLAAAKNANLAAFRLNFITFYPSVLASSPAQRAIRGAPL
jgi:hypothetical protein